MIHYITNFLVYTFAMVGILVVGFVVYKKSISVSPQRKNSIMNIVDMMRLPDRKILYIVKCENEKFLIASSNDNVNLISKLGEHQIESIENVYENVSAPKAENESVSYANPKTKNRLLKNLLKELSDNNKTKRGNY